MTLLWQEKMLEACWLPKKKLAEGKTYYSAVSEVEYSLFRTTHLVFLYEAIYQDGTLQNAYFIHKKNGEKEEEAKLERIGMQSAYLGNKDGEKEKIDGLLNKSMLQLYFSKPKQRDAVFSERFLDYVKIAKLPDENRYMFEIPNGDKSIYDYNEQGICTKITIDSSFLKFEITLKTEGEK
ncbi:hypothetical protein C9994_12325 [Marivirga lumbricoides]|uniref:Uncharacterized protein n=1 Tax=Marivirga lumbricoides TaxID=1046115 RepID=A0A2T4DK44_9BACT|nr:hypothetical protein C9994_12325 [Marivirga lumbricoides]